MAGFIDRKKVLFNNLQDTQSSSFFKKLRNLGMHIDDLVIRQSIGVGPTETMFSGVNLTDDISHDEMKAALALQDVGPKKFIAYFDKSYRDKRDMLRKFSLNAEINHIINIIAYDSIVYDNKNKFCYPDTTGLKSLLKNEYEEKVLKDINEMFDQIYIAFRFNDDQSALSLFRQFLIEGAIAFEIVYNKDVTQIIGFKELDCASLRPDIQIENDKINRIWHQNEGNPALYRKFEESQILYISYSKGGGYNPISYIEPLIRSFNLLRILENSRIMWNVMNAQWRMKMVVPVGTKSAQRWHESLGKMAAIYKEDIYLDNSSGEISVQGRPNLQFFKNYIFPNKGGEEVQIDSIQNQGPDLSNMDALKYFRNKLILESNIPMSRFNQEGTVGNVQFIAEGAEREEIRFSKFITLLRSSFQELIFKPLWISVCLKYPQFKNDSLVRSNIGIRYNTDNPFEKQKRLEILINQVDGITKLRTLVDDAGKPLLPMEFLLDKFSDFTWEELQEAKINIKFNTTKSTEGAPVEGAAVGEAPTTETPAAETDVNTTLTF